MVSNFDRAVEPCEFRLDNREEVSTPMISSPAIGTRPLADVTCFPTFGDNTMLAC